MDEVEWVNLENSRFGFSVVFGGGGVGVDVCICLCIYYIMHFSWKKVKFFCFKEVEYELG